MSKQGTSRSRAEKNRGAVSIVAPITNDIVPGKYTEYDLNLSIEQENTDEYIFAIIETILQDTEKQIYQKYLQNRIVPFTIDLAKNAMLKIIEWDFLCHDKGELDKFEDVWEEDIEPESCKIDSWAQGYFPKRQATFELGHNPTEITEFVVEENSKVEESEEEIDESITKLSSEFVESEINSSYSREKDEIFENEPDEDNETEEMEINVNSKKPIRDKVPKERLPFKPYRGKLNFDDLNMLTETLSETEQRLEIEYFKREEKLLRGASSRSNTSRQIEKIDYEKKVIQKLFGTTVKNYQQMRSGDILSNANEQLIAMMKIPSEQLMPQRVKANHKTLDVGLSRAVIAANKENSVKKKVPGIEKSSLNQIKQDEFRFPFSQNDKHPLPVSMLDSIDPVPGVVVQEGDRIKRSINKKLDREKQMEKEFQHLRPVKNQATRSAYMIEDILNVNKVNIKPMSSTTPVPPIAEGFKICD